jgi:hypothetical protein
MRYYENGRKIVACRGVHFALTEEHFKKILECKTDDELIELIQEEIEEEWDEEWLRETDKAWDAIHRCLTDGKLEWQNGSFPLNAVILGGQQLYKGDDYIVSLVSPEQVHSIADALGFVDKEILRRGYDQISQENYDGDISEEDFEYTWTWFEDLPSLYKKASSENRAILFSVDQ